MEYIKSAWKNIKMNKGRTVLTMLGIIIGISSVIAILSIGNGLKSRLTNSLDAMVNGAVTINIDQRKTTRYLTNEDLKDMTAALPLIEGASPAGITPYGTGKTRHELGVYMIGGNEYGINEFKKGFYSGRYYNEDEIIEGADVCVLTQADALLLFRSYEVQGQQFEVEIGNITRTLTIVGVVKCDDKDLENTENIIHSGNLDYYVANVYVPYTLITSKYGVSSDHLTSFNIYPVTGMADEAAAKAKSMAENMLDLRGENAVRIQSYASMMEMYVNILDSVTLVIALIAAISLLVGGIGVMNIMTVTVTERTREIGIRKSLGARTSSILFQFLVESSMITLLAGLIGMILGFVLSSLVGYFADLTAVIKPSDVALVVSISISVGLFFGIYPARKAAHMNPIDALRTE